MTIPFFANLIKKLCGFNHEYVKYSEFLEWQTELRIRISKLEQAHIAASKPKKGKGSGHATRK